MPYKVEKCGEQWCVVNTSTNETKARHDTEDDANGQVRLLHMIEKERDNG